MALAKYGESEVVEMRSLDGTGRAEAGAAQSASNAAAHGATLTNMSAEKSVESQRCNAIALRGAAGLSITYVETHNQLTPTYNSHSFEPLWR